MSTIWSIAMNLRANTAIGIVNLCSFFDSTKDFSSHLLKDIPLLFPCSIQQRKMFLFLSSIRRGKHENVTRYNQPHFLLPLKKNYFRPSGTLHCFHIRGQTTSVCTGRRLSWRLTHRPRQTLISRRKRNWRTRHRRRWIDCPEK